DNFPCLPISLDGVFLYFPPEPFAPWRGAKVGNFFSISKTSLNFFFFSFSPGQPPEGFSLKRAAKVSNFFHPASTFQNFFSDASRQRPSFRKRGQRYELLFIRQAFFQKFFPSFPEASART
ncbi:hypothetical protein, partial [Pontibacter mucosus]|uniref:hypothetical protein n=1 Tax=Pontibacter mucosus TaxID=1649266 RepID=UPI001B875D47